MNYSALLASDGEGEAVRATVQSPGRDIGSSSIPVNALTNWPTGPCIITTGTLQANNTIASPQVFYGTASGTSVTIGSFAAGYTDLGNSAGDVVVIKPCTEWANLVGTHINNITGGGTPEPVTASTLGVTGAITFAGAIGGAGYSMATMYNPYKFRAYRGNALSIPNGENLIIFDTKNYDTGNNYSTSTGKFIAPITGFYHFSSRIGLSPYATTSYAISLYKNGNPCSNGNEWETNTSNNIGLLVMDSLELSAGDYIQVYVLNGNSGNTVIFPTTEDVYFNGFLISAT